MRPLGLRSHVSIGLGVLATVVVGGTAWYSLVEGMTFVDALYQTITTVSTVGFREVERFDTSGKLFTMVLIIVGVGATLFTLSAVFEDLVEEQLGRFGRRQLDRSMADLRDHVVVCGYGRIGATVAELLSDEGPVVVIESDGGRAERATEAGCMVILGDATDESVLTRARLDRARTLVAALATDADNVFVVLSGRSANGGLRIVARAESVRSEPMLRRAGADRVVNPEEIGARRIAAFVQRPNVSEFLDVVMHGSPVEYRLEEVVVGAGAALDGVTIRDAAVRETIGALVVGVRSGSGELLTNPPAETRLEAGTTIIAMGSDAQLLDLAQRAGGAARRSRSRRSPRQTDRR